MMANRVTQSQKSKLRLPAIILIKITGKFEVRILTSFWAGDVGTDVDFLYSVMWVTNVTF